MPEQLITLYVRYTRIDARLHIVRARPGAEMSTPALCGHRWGRWPTTEWLFRPTHPDNWCAACLKAEREAPHA